MKNESINYSELVDQAMHWVVKQSLGQVKDDQLPGNHHFFISFFTRYPGVLISPRLLAKYPTEMTIVLQYQFEEFTVTEKDFGVTLTFSGIRERIEIPYQALISFADPSVKFVLQFHHELVSESAGNKAMSETINPETKSSQIADNVISLDQFRKKRN